jgi:hypothetical protein
MIVNSSQGGGSKDTWVLAGDPSGADGGTRRATFAPPQLPGLRRRAGADQQQQQQQARSG